MLKVGAHVSTAGGLWRAVERAQAIGAQCMQIFVSPPQRWAEPKHTAEEVARFRQMVDQTGLGPNYIHAIYLINLASPDDELRTRSTAVLARSMDWSDRLGTAGVIVHLGSARGESTTQAEDRVLQSLATVLSMDHRSLLILENAAGMGDSVGADFAQLGRLVRAMEHHPRLRVCLDTAHCLAAGYDLTTPEGLESTVSSFRREVGLGLLEVVHANDSKVPLGAGVDRHENIGKGHIGAEAFARIMAHPVFRQKPFLLEVPGATGQGPDEENVAILKRLAQPRR